MTATPHVQYGDPVTTPNTNLTSLSEIKQETIQADVLVVGGGIAGIFAALRAKEKGLNVVVADKGEVAKSGLSPYFGAFTVFEKPEEIPTIEDFIKATAEAEHWLMNRTYFQMWIEDSKDRYEELAAWGALEKNGRIKLRKVLREKGVNLVERVMVTELLEKDDRISGAVAFPMEEDKIIVFKVRSIILCSGAGAFKTPGFPIRSLTHDGDAMAYRLGLEISGKEFCDYHVTIANDPGGHGVCNDDMDSILPIHKVPTRPPGMRPPEMFNEAHAGNIPIIGRGRPEGPEFNRPVVWGSAAGASPHKCEGIFPQDDKFGTGIAGLYAAGDALCTSGAVYGTGGYAAPASAVQGARAGIIAADFAAGSGPVEVGNDEIDQAAERIFAPRMRNKGYSPAWITQALQGIMVPYYVLHLKKEDRLKNALGNIEFIRDQLLPTLMARDTHELRLAHETFNMFLNAEMRLKASIMRTETRGSHRREDFPEQDDKNWLAWITISKDGDNMKLTKRSIPEEWRP